MAQDNHDLKRKNPCQHSYLNFRLPLQHFYMDVSSGPCKLNRFTVSPQRFPKICCSMVFPILVNGNSIFPVVQPENLGVILNSLPLTPHIQSVNKFWVALPSEYVLNLPVPPPPPLPPEPPPTLTSSCLDDYNLELVSLYLLQYPLQGPSTVCPHSCRQNALFPCFILFLKTNESHIRCISWGAHSFIKK